MQIRKNRTTYRIQGVSIGTNDKIETSLPRAFYSCFKQFSSQWLGSSFYLADKNLCSLMEDKTNIKGITAMEIDTVKKTVFLYTKHNCINFGGS